MDYKYTLRKGSKKDKCPKCGKNTFVPFVDRNGNKVGDRFGRCDRENNCAYFNYPKSGDVNYETLNNKVKFNNIKKPEPISFLDPDIVKKYISDQRQIINSFLFRYFEQYMDNLNLVKQFNLYGVGGDFYGNSVFPQIDYKFRVRTAKVIPYGTNGKRRKDMQPCWFLHPNPEEQVKTGVNFNLKQVFFGEHLLNYQNNYEKIRLVESEKTALILSCVQPKILYLAAGGSCNVQRYKFFYIDIEKLEIIPDSGMHDRWVESINFISKDKFINIDNMIEKGGDILDLYLEKGILI